MSTRAVSACRSRSPRRHSACCATCRWSSNRARNRVMARDGAALLLALCLAASPSAAADPVHAQARPAVNLAQGKAAGDRGEKIFGDFSSSHKGEPISVRSDKLEFSYRERLLTYTGQVVVTQGDLTMHADVLKVTITDQQPPGLEEIVATGGVEITQGNRSASGGKAVFDQQKRTIELSDGAVLTEGLNKISGERVIVYLDQERSVVEGGDRRVQALLYPGENLEDLGGAKKSSPE